MCQQRILLVDDEERVADALSRVLSLPQGGNYQVEWCSSGEAALMKLQETYPDLLITDLRMPGMSGLELLERAHQVSPNTRSLLITAFGAPEVEAQALRLANAYLPKPFTLATFLQTIQQALNAPPTSPLAGTALSADSLQAMSGRLDVLRMDTGAYCALLPDCAGHLLAECGQHGEFDSGILTALLGNSMAAATEVGRLLNEAVGFDLHYHEGKHVEVYSAMVSDTIFIVLLFDRRAGGGRFGRVSLYMQRAIEDLRRMLSQTAAEPVAPLMRQSSGAIEEALDKLLSFQPDELFNVVPDRQEGNDRADSASPSVEEAYSPADMDGSLLTLEQARRPSLVNLNQLDATG